MKGGLLKRGLAMPRLAAAPTLAACALSVLGGSDAQSVLLDSSHVPWKSRGCGKLPPYWPGWTSVVNATFEGVQWQYRVYLPKSYDMNTPMPIIFQLGGWGASAEFEEGGSGIQARADDLGFISVTPQGQADDVDPDAQEYSWNAAGTTYSLGPGGPTCLPYAVGTCYKSCGQCVESPDCSWTTCLDGITPSGTGRRNVNGFLASLYDTLEEQLCIDTTREYHGGQSNGGMMAYQIGVDMASRVAAVFPQFASFHRGFNLAPAEGVAVADLHGWWDDTIPANHSLSSDGWYYTPTTAIFYGNEFSPGWRKANLCFGPSFHFPTSLDGVMDLYCVSEGLCLGGGVVRCTWNGSHSYFGYDGSLHGQLVTEFLLRWTKPTHIGGGYRVGEEPGPPQLLDEIHVVEQLKPSQEPRSSPLAQREAASYQGPYGDPATGCLEGETLRRIADGHACAPRIGVEVNSTSQIPQPQCRLGLAARGKGCPDFKDSNRAFPVCLADVGETKGVEGAGDFYCILACPCNLPGNDCGPDADAECPGSAVCRRGAFRHMGYGVCTYPVQDGAETRPQTAGESFVV